MFSQEPNYSLQNIGVFFTAKPSKIDNFEGFLTDFVVGKSFIENENFDRFLTELSTNKIRQKSHANSKRFSTTFLNYFRLIFEGFFREIFDGFGLQGNF